MKRMPSAYEWYKASVNADAKKPAPAKKVQKQVK